MFVFGIAYLLLLVGVGWVRCECWLDVYGLFGGLGVVVCGIVAGRLGLVVICAFGFGFWLLIWITGVCRW